MAFAVSASSHFQVPVNNTNAAAVSEELKNLTSLAVMSSFGTRDLKSIVNVINNLEKALPTLDGDSFGMVSCVTFLNEDIVF